MSCTCPPITILSVTTPIGDVPQPVLDSRCPVHGQPRCTCATSLGSDNISLRNPDCPSHGEALKPQNYDEIEACLEIIYGNGLPDSTPKGKVRDACIARLKEMRQ